MTQVGNDLEGGTNGVTITTSNAGGTGNQLFDIAGITNSGVLPVFDNTHTRGVMAAKISSSLASGTTRLGWNATSLGSVSEVWLRFYAYFTANPGANLYLAAVIHGATSDGATLRLNSTGHLFVEDNAGGIQATMTTAIALNQWVRMEFHVLLSATNGTMDAWLYNTADAEVGSPTETIQSTVGPTGTAGNLYDMFLFGAPFQILSVQGPWWIDDLAASTTAQLGPSTGTTPPTVAVAGVADVPTSYVSAFTPGVPSPGYRYVLRQAAQQASRW